MIMNDELLPEEVTKQAIRKKVWDYLESNNLANFPRPVHGRIPNFKGSEEAAQKLSQLDIFKNASTIKVNPDKPQQTVRFLALEARKSLLVPIPSLRSGLFQHVQPPSDALKQELKVAASRRGLEEWGKPVGLDDKVKVDLVVLGSVAVSKEGYRIGKGEGYADLEFAMMMKMGAVDQSTIVASTVHDCQVFDTLPAQLFKEHDVPVDFIITPTQVIEINPRLPKPSGIIWSILSERRLNDIPILQTLREAELGEGKDCTLKEIDSDIDDQRPNGNAEGRNRFKKRRNFRPNKSAVSDETGEGKPVVTTDGSETTRPMRMFRRRRNTPRKGTSGSEQEDGSRDNVNENEHATTKKERRRPVRPRQKPAIEFSLRVGNIASNVRVRDLKAALAERGVKPTDITWRGHRGFAFLHFAKAGGSNIPVPSAPIAVDNIMASLQDLKVGTEDEGDFLKIEPAKPITRIEVTDISSV